MMYAVIACAMVLGLSGMAALVFVAVGQGKALRQFVGATLDQNVRLTSQVMLGPERELDRIALQDREASSPAPMFQPTMAAPVQPDAEFDFSPTAGGIPRPVGAGIG